MDSRPTALITGGARGIGLALTQRLAQDYRVAISHRGPVSVLPDGVIPIRSDFTNADSIPELSKAVIAEFGSLDLLVNNAATFEEDNCLAVNADAPRKLLDTLVDHMPSGASVVSISSVNARLPAMAAPAYSASKAALDSWTRWAAKVHGPKGIRVNAVAPGPVDVPDNPRPEALKKQFLDLLSLGRFASPEDIAEAVSFLASPQAKSITGQILDVCAGYRL